MLAENLAVTYQPMQQHLHKEQCSIQYKEVDDHEFNEGMHYTVKHKALPLLVLSDESSYPESMFSYYDDCMFVQYLSQVLPMLMKIMMHDLKRNW